MKISVRRSSPKIEKKTQEEIFLVSTIFPTFFNGLNASLSNCTFFHVADDSRRSLREKVAQLRQERMAAETNLNAQDSQLFQQHMTQIRRQMLMHTIEGLKRSLEDQSATLKQTCLLEDSVINNEMP